MDLGGPSPAGTPRGGFSLPELLIVVVIIAVLASLLLPAVGMVRDAARRTYCANNLRNVHIAVSIYCEDGQGVMPFTECASPLLPNTWYNTGRYVGGQPGTWADSIVTEDILPEGSVVIGGHLLGRNTSVMSCPTFRGRDVLYGGGLSIIGYGANPLLFPRITVPADWGKSMRVQAVHQTSTCVLATECTGTQWWIGSAPPYQPLGIAEDDVAHYMVGWASYWVGRHRGGANALFCDGRVSYLSNLYDAFNAGSIALDP